MPNKTWSNLNPLQVGRYAEYFSKMEFTSYGYHVYTAEVDDHGIDFIAESRQGNLYKVQVKSVRIANTKYVFIKKDAIVINDSFLVSLLLFTDNEMPQFYIFPATVWEKPNSLFVIHIYKNKKEYGINLSKKNMPILEQYKAEKFF